MIDFVFLLRSFYILFWGIITFHPIHVTITNFEIDTTNHEIKYSIRIFADDFAYAIEHLYEENISFMDGISQQEKEVLIAYTNSKLEIIINGWKCSPKCQKIDTMNNSLWIHFKIPLKELEISSMKIINKLLLDLFVDQTNLIIITINGKQMGYTFNYMNQEAEIDVN